MPSCSIVLTLSLSLSVCVCVCMRACACVFSFIRPSCAECRTNPKDPIKQLVIGAVAGGASRFLTAPLERIRIMMMAGDGVTPFGAVASVLKGEGPAGLWRGCTPKILKVMPGSAIQFATFARVKSLFMRLNKDGDIKPWQTLAAGAAAGFASTIVVSHARVQPSLPLFPYFHC